MAKRIRCWFKRHGGGAQCACGSVGKKLIRYGPYVGFESGALGLGGIRKVQRAIEKWRHKLERKRLSERLREQEW